MHPEWNYFRAALTAPNKNKASLERYVSDQVFVRTARSSDGDTVPLALLDNAWAFTSMKLWNETWAQAWHPDLAGETNRFGIAPWMAAISVGRLGVLPACLQGLSPEVLNAPGVNGWAAVHWLAHFKIKDRATLAVFKAAGASAEVVGSAGDTPADVARVAGLDDFAAIWATCDRPATPRAAPAEGAKPVTRPAQSGFDF